MVVDGHGVGAAYYAEVQILGNSVMGLMMVGVGRPGLDVRQVAAFETEEFWGLASSTGALWHANQRIEWAGSGLHHHFGQGDTFGLLLDCGAGRLVVYKNGARLGVAAAGLTGELCWMVAMDMQGGRARITGKLPPVGWRLAEEAAAGCSEVPVQ